LHEAVAAYVADTRLAPPLSWEELEQHTRMFLNLHPVEDAAVVDAGLVSILLNNAVWRDTVAAVPFERRLLLLPQCLRNPATCPADIDEFGLLCRRCGRCRLGEFQAAAEELGYVVLIAEGSAIVTRLLEGGAVDAVIGVSCREVLAKTFPRMAAEAIPGLAVPLLCDGCRETLVDAEWLMDVLRLRSPGPGPLDLTALRRRTAAWFAPEAVAELIPGESETEVMARDWLAAAGKRWRPFLALAAWQAVVGNEIGDDDRIIRRLAVAVECFHKASLIHDDIEDDDDFRYGAETLHRRHGVPVALNLGDLLIGEGYRLIATSGAPAERIARMLAVAAEGHRRLCLGQGEELLCLSRPEPPDSALVLEVFRHKTAPAFAVALQLGAVAADVDAETDGALGPFSDALGIAYQIHDDLDDLQAVAGGGPAHSLRTSLLLALAWEQAGPDLRRQLACLWRDGEPGPDALALLRDPQVIDKARQLADHYRNEAGRAINTVRHAALKTLLRRVIGRILDRGSVS
jgi:geranylgeranyl pyrophosphate synthase